MTPAALDAGVIRQKLDAIEGSLSTLEALGQFTAACLTGDPVVAAAGSGSFHGPSTSAVEVNSHIVAAFPAAVPATTGVVPMAANAGVIDAEIGRRAGAIGRDAERDRPSVHPARPRYYRRRRTQGH